MQYFRCKCGNLESWSSDGTTPCRACSKCGTTLAQHPDDHRTPVPHQWQTQYDQNTGKPFEFCRVCLTHRGLDEQSQVDEKDRRIAELQRNVTELKERLALAEGADKCEACGKIIEPWNDGVTRVGGHGLGRKIAGWTHGREPKGNNADE